MNNVLLKLAASTAVAAIALCTALIAWIYITDRTETRELLSSIADSVSSMKGQYTTATASVASTSERLKNVEKSIFIINHNVLNLCDYGETNWSMERCIRARSVKR